MNYLHVWCDLKDGSRDLEFSRAVAAYLGYLQGKGKISGYRLTRRKFGFGPAELGDFHVEISAVDLTALDQAFDLVAARDGELEKLHHAVYSSVKNVKSALYRDFPDPVRRA